MQLTEPNIYLLAEPRVDWDAVGRYLYDIGGEDWLERVDREDSEAQGQPVSDAERLVEFMGRLCYKSWNTELNRNVTRIREDSKEYIRNLIASGHGAVVEHSQFSFLFQDVSRVFTHELVRHRVGVAISQESLRYVALDELSVWVPDELRDENGEPYEAVVSIVEKLEDVQVELREITGIDEEGVPFSEKKKVQSALRRLAPIGLATNMGWSANVRTLRHVIPLRTSKHAETEIRLVFAGITEMLKERYPLLFGDMEISEVEDGIPAYEPTA